MKIDDLIVLLCLLALCAFCWCILKVAEAVDWIKARRLDLAIGGTLLLKIAIVAWMVIGV